MNYITILGSVQVAITIFVYLVIELAKAVFTGLDLATQLGGTGMLELRQESSNQTRKSLICSQRVVIFRQK